MSETLERERNKFTSFLERTGKKMSPARLTVFNAAMRAHGHFTAEDLMKAMEKVKGGVSRATVYRSLHDLLEAGVIRETAYGEKHIFYEHLYDEKAHHHARCIHCHGVIEFPALGIDEKYETMLCRKGFKVLGHEIHFYGICRNCQ